MSENDSQKIEIRTDGAFSEIYVDGHQLKGVRRFKLEHGVGNQFPILTVDLNALNLSIDGRMLLYQEGYGEINIEFKETEEKN